MLPSPERIRRASLFQRIYAERKSIATPLMTLYVLPRQARSAPALPHVGFVVAKKVDKRATKRNLVRRRVREAYRLVRLKEVSVKQWYAMILVIHDKALDAQWGEICAVVKGCLSQASERFGRAGRKYPDLPQGLSGRQGQ